MIRNCWCMGKIGTTISCKFSTHSVTLYLSYSSPTPPHTHPSLPSLPTKKTQIFFDQTNKLCDINDVSYSYTSTLHLRGGNTRIDYYHQCVRLQGDRNFTYERKCEIVRDWELCADLGNCTKVIQPPQGCCPICG